MASTASFIPSVLPGRPFSRLVISVLCLGILAACVRATPAPVERRPVPRSVPPRLELPPPLEQPSLPPRSTPAVSVNRHLLGDVQYNLPVEANSWVESEINFLVNERRDVVERWMQRGDYYRDFVYQVFEEYGLPTDLYHLALIESGFLPAARSSSGAVGVWQFMAPTAGDVGLRIDRTVDERMDPVRSTRAAARHLRGLYRVLDDWALSAAAYNAGGGRITRGLAAVSAVDFWDLSLRGDLSQETRDYVPRLYAMTIIGRDRERFGFQPRADIPPFAFDSIFVDYSIPLEEIAKLGTSSLDELNRLNPHLLRGVTPSGGYWLWVPAGEGQRMQIAYFAAGFDSDFGVARYTVRRGDTLGDLAARSGVSSARIRELNPSINFDRLLAGAVIDLPQGGVDRIAARASGDDRPATTAPRPAAPPPEPTSPVPRVSQTALEAAAAGPGGNPAAASSSSSEPERLASATGRAEEATTREPAAHRPSLATALPSSRASTSGGASASRTPASTASSASSSAGRSTRASGAAASPRSAAGRQSTYRVRDGDSLWSIANDKGVTVEQLREANSLRNSVIRPGQDLKIPAATANGASTRQVASTVYKVRDGDSLWSIARDKGVTVEQLQEENSLSGEVIRPGQDLMIPVQAASGGSASEAASIVHVVQNGDTLWEIARRHGSSIEAIERANSLGQRPIIAGQRLTVPL